MLNDDFIDYWNKVYPETLPIGHELKSLYSERWFRIHSLPDSRRYAQCDKDYKTILQRQNDLITDLIGEDTEVFICLTLTLDDMNINNYKELKGISEFRKVWTVNLKEKYPLSYEEDLSLDIYIKIERWKKGLRDDLLIAIADDKIRAMIICPAKSCIIAPYDGGVDVILDSSETRDKLKVKYKDWLSSRQDGL